MYQRKKNRPAARLIAASLVMVLAAWLLGRLDFPGWVMRGIAELIPHTEKAVYSSEEIEEIRDHVGTLEAENAILRDMVLNLQEESGLERLMPQIGYDLLPARIIYRDYTRLFQTAIINRGTSDGVEVGMPVVDTDGLVGRVVSARAAVSRIELITSPDCSVGVIDQRSREMGVVRGSDSVSWEIGSSTSNASDMISPGILILEYLSPSADISVHDTLVTSGLSGITPPGIRVGEVVEIILRAEQGLFDIRVRPFADIEHLSTVAVVLFRDEHQDELMDLVNESVSEAPPAAPE